MSALALRRAPTRQCLLLAFTSGARAGVRSRGPPRSCAPSSEASSAPWRR